MKIDVNIEVEGQELKELVAKQVNETGKITVTPEDFKIQAFSSKKNEWVDVDNVKIVYTKV